MNIIIKTKNLELDSQLRDFVNDKINKLKKFLTVFRNHDQNMVFDTFVEIEKETIHHKKGDIFRVEIKLCLPGKNLVAEATKDEVAKAVLEAKDELEREIQTYKLKTTELPRRKIKKQSPKIR
jgi:ribosomal subunit interface protein